MTKVHTEEQISALLAVNNLVIDGLGKFANDPKVTSAVQELRDAISGWSRESWTRSELDKEFVRMIEKSTSSREYRALHFAMRLIAKHYPGRNTIIEESR